MDKNKGLNNQLLYIAVIVFLVSSFMLITSSSKTRSDNVALLGKAYQEGDSYVNRTFVTHPVRVNETFWINLSVRNLNNDYIYAIEEHVPSGFVILDDYSSSYSDSSQLKWISYSNISPAPNVDFLYQVQAPSSAGDYTFTGSYQFESTPSNSSDDIVGQTVYTVLPPDYPPTVTLVSPPASYVTFSDSVTFQCSATDDSAVSTITLYSDYFGSWSQLTSVAGSSINYPVSGLVDSTFYWNCEACDDAGQCVFNSQNRSIQIVAIPVALNESAFLQTPANPAVDGADITIEMPVVRYYNQGTHTVSVTLPALWTDTSNFRVVEGGSTPKTVTVGADNLTWSADLTQSAVMRFDVPAPALTNEVVFSNASLYNKTFDIIDSNHLTNIQATISVLDGYSSWKLYQYETGVWPDRTGAYGLIVASGIASFSGFDTSNLTFMITAVNTTSSTTGLVIWDSTESATVYPNETISFYSRYFDLSTGANLTGAQASCNVTFIDGTFDMTYDPSLTSFTYNRSFINSGDYTYDVWCSGPGYDPLTLSDLTTVTPLPFCPDGTCNGGEDCNTCAADCGSCPPSPPPGGGGGSGSRDTGGDDLEKIFEFDHEIYSISTLAVLRGITVQAVELDSVAVSAPDLPVYKYFQVTASTSFQRATVRFKIPKTWYSSNNMNKLTTTFMRHNGQEWEILLTQKEFEDYDYIYFMTSATQFSTVALTAEQNPYVAPPTIPDTNPDGPTVEVPTTPEIPDGEPIVAPNISINESGDGDNDDNGGSIFQSFWAYLAFASAMFIVIFFIIFTINKRKQMEFSKVTKELDEHLEKQQQKEKPKVEEPKITQQEEVKIEKEAESLSKEARVLDQRLENYVKECKQKGFSSEQVRQSLEQAGWNVEDIQEALSRAFVS